MNTKDKLTALEKKWILYDVANSAFTLLISTIIPLYFNSLAETAGLTDVEYLARWGYAISVSTLIVAFSGPVLGAFSDKAGRKKPLFAATIFIGAAGCLALGLARQWLLFLVVFVVARVAYSLSLVLYDSMLSDVTTEARMDTVSSHGYAWGYIGSCVPFILCLLLVLNADRFGLATSTAMMISFAVVAVWWVAVSMPLLRSYRQMHFLSDNEIAAEPGILAQLGETLKDMVRKPKILLFLLSFFFYIDGVYTIIDMSTAYGSALGLNSTDLLLALLVTQFVAFPSALIMGRLSRSVSSEKLITVCICAYFCIACFAFFLAHAWQFWVLAICVGMFQGGIQALSRSHFTKIIPPERSGEYFGFMDICGKGAAFLGTILMSFVSQVTGRISFGIIPIALFFLLGLVLFRLSIAKDRA